jgi:hypothetical protein
MHVVDLIPCEKADGNAVPLNKQDMLSPRRAQNIAAQLVGGAARMGRIAFVEIAA